MVGTLAGNPATHADEAAEVARAKRDRHAFAPLYLRYFDRVHGYCYRQLGTAEEAADATSLVFARALAALPSCREESFRSWLFAIAHNVLADVYRARRLDTSLDDVSALPDRGQSPEEAALAGEARSTVTWLLTHLPADQRHVLELRLAGLSSREIGEVLGRSSNAVDQVQFRAMTRLKLLASELSSREEQQ